MSSNVALYLLNHKRAHLLELETKFETHIIVASDDSLIPPKYTIERSQPLHQDGEDDERPERPEPRRERNEQRNNEQRADRNEQRADTTRSKPGDRIDLPAAR